MSEPIYKVTNPTLGFRGGITTPNGKVITSIFDLVTELNTLHRLTFQPAHDYKLVGCDLAYPSLAHVIRPDGTRINDEPIWGNQATKFVVELNTLQSIIKHGTGTLHP